MNDSNVLKPAGLHDFLKSKRIDPEALMKGNKTLWLRWSDEFPQTSQQAFELQARFLLNNLRHEYPLAVEMNPDTKESSASAPLAKQAIRQPVLRNTENQQPETT